jgi:hypothetical protein
MPLRTASPVHCTGPSVLPPPTRHVEDTGNFFGDGNTGIVFQNDNGSVALWNMSSTNIVGGGLVASEPGPTWHINVQAATSAVSGGAMINLGNGSSLLLPGVDAGSLHTSSFALA